jgi:hypothetical protein
MGAVFGILASRLVPRGEGKTLVVSLMVCMITAGVIALAAGVAALLLKQPYHVWYPLLLGGGICAMVFGGNLPMILMRYKQAEARRLDAESMRRS